VVVCEQRYGCGRNGGEDVNQKKFKDRHHKAPRWFVRRIQFATGIRGTNGTTICSYFNSHPCRSIFDHWGACGDVFYCEPYDTEENVLRKALEIANEIGCLCRLAPSKWNPPSTVRVEFYTIKKEVWE
jgi:hypothetical protein